MAKLERMCICIVSRGNENIAKVICTKQPIEYHKFINMIFLTTKEEIIDWRVFTVARIQKFLMLCDLCKFDVRNMEGFKEFCNRLNLKV